MKLYKMLVKEQEMTKLKPDYIYSICENQYPGIHGQRFGSHTRALLGVASEMVHPYFIFEGKTTEGELLDIENQAILGGAIFIQARRLLNAKVGNRDVLGADLSSFIYSIAIDTNSVRISLKWCNILPKKRQKSGVRDGGQRTDSKEL